MAASGTLSTFIRIMAGSTKHTVPLSGSARPLRGRSFLGLFGGASTLAAWLSRCPLRCHLAHNILVIWPSLPIVFGGLPGQGELRASRRSWAIGRQIGYGFLARFRPGYEDRKPGLSPARRPARNAGYGSRRDASDPKGYPPRRHDKRIHEIVMGRAQATNRNEVSAHMLAFYRASSTFLISRDISRNSSLVWR